MHTKCKYSEWHSENIKCKQKDFKKHFEQYQTLLNQVHITVHIREYNWIRRLENFTFNGEWSLLVHTVATVATL